jgi:hypothetical protein
MGLLSSAQPNQITFAITTHVDDGNGRVSVPYSITTFEIAFFFFSTRYNFRFSRITSAVIMAGLSLGGALNKS